jgi:hypothetical protein
LPWTFAQQHIVWAFGGGIFLQNHPSVGEVTLGRLRRPCSLQTSGGEAAFIFGFVYAVHKLWDIEIQIILLIFTNMRIWDHLNGALANYLFNLFGDYFENSSVGIVSGLRCRDF